MDHLARVHALAEDIGQTRRAFQAEDPGQGPLRHIAVHQQNGVVHLHGHAHGQVEGREGFALPRQRAGNHDQIEMLVGVGLRPGQVGQQGTLDEPVFLGKLPVFLRGGQAMTAQGGPIEADNVRPVLPRRLSRRR